MFYLCKRCGHTTNHIGNLKTHLQKKKTCKPTYADIDRNLLLHELTTPNGKKEFIIKITDQIIPFDEVSDPKQFIHELQQDNTQLKHENITLKQENTQLKTKLYALQTTAGISGNVTNNTTNNNININIINNFGKENMDYITPEFLNQTIQQVYDSIPTLLKHIHFNPEHPENHNLKLPNKRDKYMLVKRSDQWKHENKRDVLDSLVRKAHYYMVDHIPNDDIPNHDRLKKNCILLHRQKLDDEDKDTIKDAHNRVEIMILNSRPES